MLRRLVHRHWVRAACARLIAGYIRMVWRTGRWEVLGGEIPARFQDAGRPFIAAFWHGRLLMMPCAWRFDEPMNVLISRHRDGEMISATMRHFGIGSVRGSSGRGGQAALRELVRMLRGGTWIAITPDGPRGPRMRVSGGIVATARLAGAPIVPVSFSAERGRVLGSWDRFLLALPFSRGRIVFGEPVEVPAGAGPAEIETARLEVERRLNWITADADRHCGRIPVVPDHAGA